MELRAVELAGTPREMGRQFGEALRDQTRQFTEERLGRCIEAAAEAGLPVQRPLVLDVCGRMLEAHRRYDEAVWEEMEGIAEGAGISPELLMICNGLTDVQDAVLAAAGAEWARAGAGDTGGCTSWMAAEEATEAGKTLMGQTWDMHASAVDYIVVVKRKPNRGPATISMTTAGCLSLIGINSAGVAIGNNNLKPIDAMCGVIYLAMIHKALGQRHTAEAINAITLADRCSGHNYYLAGRDGEIVDIETTAAAFEVIQPAGATYAHTNHYLTPRLQKLEQPEAVNASTTWRLTRMLHILAEQAGQITAEQMMRAMSDSSGQGECRICRIDPEDRSPTCGAAVLSPQTQQMWVVRGRPEPERFVEFAL